MSKLSINSNIASLNAQRRFADSTSSLQKTFERLSSGLRINKASDDAAGLSISESLNVDARVANQAIRNVNDGISLLNVADSATNSLKNILTRMRELSTQASNGTMSDRQRSALDTENQALIIEYNRILDTTAFNGISLFSSGNQSIQIQAGYGSDGTISVNLPTTDTTGGTFQSQQQITTGGGPHSVQTIDVNNDGQLDLVSPDYAGGISVELGNGDGTFRSRITSTGGVNALFMTSGDLNGDGKVDLVTSNDTAGTATVLLGNGDGRFTQSSTQTLGANPREVALFDFNGDGKLDLLASIFNGPLSLSLGNGDGTFATAQTVGAALHTYGFEVKDINKDNKLDIIATNLNNVGVLLGNGNGTFGAPQTYAVGSNANSVDSADFNGDGNIDLVVANGVDNTVSLLLGNGSGGFGAQTTFASAPTTYMVRAIDVNADGYSDIVTAGNNASGELDVMMGNGDGTFKTKQAYSVGSGPLSFNFGDMNNDGNLDLVAPTTSGSYISVLFGNSPNGISHIGSINLGTRTDALAAQCQIDNKMKLLNTVTGVIGASMSRLEVASNTLKVSSENFSAARSQITDVDYAVEAAYLIRSQILQQAGASVLSQANQQPALAIRLLKGI